MPPSAKKENSYAEKARMYIHAMNEYPSARASEVIYDLLFMNLAEYEEAKFIEIGSGSGYVTNILVDIIKKVKAYYLCDPNILMMKHAKEVVKGRLSFLSKKFITKPIDSIIGKYKNKFDIALSHAAFHHFIVEENGKVDVNKSKEFQEKIVNAMSDFVRPGGKVLIVDVPSKYQSFLGNIYFDVYPAKYLSNIHFYYIDKGLDYKTHLRLTRKVLEYNNKLGEALQQIEGIDTSKPLRKIFKDAAPEKRKEIRQVISKHIGGPFEMGPETTSLIVDEDFFKKLGSQPEDERGFFEDVVAKYSVAPHLASFISPKELYGWLNKAGLENVFVGVLPTPWWFNNKKEAIEFVKYTFGLKNIKNHELEEKIDEYLGYSEGYNYLRWHLMYGYGEKPES